MDSPFDYVFKMRKQISAIANTQDENGQAPDNSWWAYNVTMPDGGVIAGDDAAEGTSDEDTRFDRPTGAEKYKGIKYVPGLGLYIKTPTHAYNEDAAGEEGGDNPDTWDEMESTADLSWRTTAPVNQRRRSASWIIEAGTDCVGFVQRSASYVGNTYRYTDLPKGMMEYNDGAGSENVFEVMNRYGDADSNQTADHQDGFRAYPTDVGYSIISGTPFPVSYPSIAAMKKIVPGDIFVKNGSSHIAIIAEVPTSEDYTAVTDSEGNIVENDVNKLKILDKFVIIEAEFWGRIQSVIKQLTLKDYALNGLGADQGFVGTRFYHDAYTVPTTTTSLNLNCTDWKVYRLRH
jgi:hypothetical protein